MGWVWGEGRQLWFVCKEGGAQLCSTGWRLHAWLWAAVWTRLPERWRRAAEVWLWAETLGTEWQN